MKDLTHTICCSLGWERFGSGYRVADSRGASHYVPWVLDASRLAALHTAIPLERLPLVLAIGDDPCFVHVYWKPEAQPYKDDLRTLIMDVVLPYLSMRLQLEGALCL